MHTACDCSCQLRKRQGRGGYRGGWFGLNYAQRLTEILGGWPSPHLVLRSDPFGPLRTPSDPFGPPRTPADPFGPLRTHSDPLDPFGPFRIRLMRTPSRHGRTRAPQPRRRSRAQLSERHSAVPPRRVSRRTAAFGRQSCGTEGARLLIQDLAAAARQVSAARPMRAGVLSSDRAPSPGWDRDARRKVPSRADGERSVALRSPSDRAARRRACADARASGRSPAPPQAAKCPSWR